jgi:hypothetical protein
VNFHAFSVQAGYDAGLHERQVGADSLALLVVAHDRNVRLGTVGSKVGKEVDRSRLYERQ